MAGHAEEVVRVVCGCGAAVLAPAALGGASGRCPGCGRALQLPLPPPPAPPARPAPAAPASPFQVVRLRCACGERVPAPWRLLARGEARCPRCDQALDPNATAEEVGRRRPSPGEPPRLL